MFDESIELSLRRVFREVTISPKSVRLCHIFHVKEYREEVVGGEDKCVFRRGILNNSS